MGAEATIGINKNRSLKNIENKHTKETIEYRDLDFERIASYLNGVIQEYDLLISKMEAINNLGIGSFQGEAAKEINALLEILPRYLKDYRHTIVDFQETIKSLIFMVNEIPELNVIQGIKEV